jgi:predicted NodU family carbamoyl transferase
MRILSYNPGHDGAFTYLIDGRLAFSIEAEKHSRYRHSSVSVPDAISVFGEMTEVPDVICRSGWWPNETMLTEQTAFAGYYGSSKEHIIHGKKRVLGKTIEYFSSSHERSHLLCAFGMSSIPMGTPCYALLWEGVIGAFYEVDALLNFTKLADVMPEPGHRYALLYGLADPTFDKSKSAYSRFSDAGKLMALASFSARSETSDAEERIIEFLMQDCPHLKPQDCELLKDCPYYNAGLSDAEFRNFAGIFSDRIFDRFYRFAESNMKKRMPLLVTGGCGLNCDWNTKWRQAGLFSEVFVPPVANDSGSAIGTAIDAQLHLLGNAKIEWSVYSGLDFICDREVDTSLFDEYKMDYSLIAEMIADGMILGWVNGKYEIGPRALGNRSIIASPFQKSTRVRLNEIKQREQFRPIAPVCLEEDAAKWFSCSDPSPYMLYTQHTSTDALAAVTHVNGTARIQTVSAVSNDQMYRLLAAFKKRTGFGVLCNTSLNFKGRGFINCMVDLVDYTIGHGLDGFVVGGRIYMLKQSKVYQTFISDKMTGNSEH